MSDSFVQAGAPAAAPAADGPAREPRRPRPAGKEHQHHAGHHHRHPGVRLHGRQVCRPADAEPPPRGRHNPGGLLFDHILEELGPSAAHHRQDAGAGLMGTVGALKHHSLRGLLVQSSKDNLNSQECFFYKNRTKATFM